MVTTVDHSGTLPTDQDKVLPPLMADFSQASEDKLDSNEILIKTQSGMYDTLAAYSALRDDDGNAYGSFEESKTTLKKKTLATLIAQAQAFSFGGVRLQPSDIFANLNKMAADFHDQIEKNNKAMQLGPKDIARDEHGRQIMTPEQLKAFEARHGFCHGHHVRTASEIIMVDGKPMDASLYAEYTQKNEMLATEQQRVSQYSVQMTKGTITFNDLPDDIKQSIADVQIAKTSAPAPEPTVLEQLETNDPATLKADLPEADTPAALPKLIPTLELKPPV